MNTSEGLVILKGNLLINSFQLELLKSMLSVKNQWQLLN